MASSVGKKVGELVDSSVGAFVKSSSVGANDRASSLGDAVKLSSLGANDRASSLGDAVKLSSVGANDRTSSLGALLGNEVGEKVVSASLTSSSTGDAVVDTGEEVGF